MSAKRIHVAGGVRQWLGLVAVACCALPGVAAAVVAAPVIYTNQADFEAALAALNTSLVPAFEEHFDTAPWSSSVALRAVTNGPVTWTPVATLDQRSDPKITPRSRGDLGTLAGSIGGQPDGVVASIDAGQALITAVSGTFYGLCSPQCEGGVTFVVNNPAAEQSLYQKHAIPTDMESNIIIDESKLPNGTWTSLSDTGSFLGVIFAGGIDRLAIRETKWAVPLNPDQHPNIFADDLKFYGALTTVPLPAALPLLGGALGLLGGGALARRSRCVGTRGGC